MGVELQQRDRAIETSGDLRRVVAELTKNLP